MVEKSTQLRAKVTGNDQQTNKQSIQRQPPLKLYIHNTHVYRI